MCHRKMHFNAVPKIVEQKKYIYRDAGACVKVVELNFTFVTFFSQLF